jgi:hypothetical protein
MIDPGPSPSWITSAIDCAPAAMADADPGRATPAVMATKVARRRRI